jgi:hypothetical protein
MNARRRVERLEATHNTVALSAPPRLASLRKLLLVGNTSRICRCACYCKL